MKAGGAQYIHYMPRKKDEVGGETDETMTEVTVWEVIQDNRIIIL